MTLVQVEDFLKMLPAVKGSPRKYLWSSSSCSGGADEGLAANYSNHEVLASVERAKSLIGYQPNTPFEGGLKQAIAWFKDNWDRIAAAARFGPGMSSAVRNLVSGG